MKNTLIFENTSSKEKLREGFAVQVAILNGDCDKCKYLPRCESDVTFEFPEEAACMKILKDIKENWNMKEKMQ